MGTRQTVAGGRRANPKVVGQRTPLEVLAAINVITRYLREGGWVEVIIWHNGGADFRLTSIYDDVLRTEARGDD